MRWRRLSSLLLAAALVAGLAPSVSAVRLVWTRSAERALRDTAVAPTGAVYAVGERKKSITRQAVLERYSPAGVRRWSRVWLPGVEASTHGVAVAVAADGTVYMLGRVQGQCEGGGWFVRAYAPSGALRASYMTPGWACEIAETPTDIAVGDGVVAVTGYSHGCCGDTMTDGWVVGFDRSLHRRWTTDVEPPAVTPHGWFDTALAVAVDPSDAAYVAGWAATEWIYGGRQSPLRRGTLIVQKVGAGGTAIWTKRSGPPILGADLGMGAAIHGARLAIGTSVRGLGAEWVWSPDWKPSQGWLGAFSLDGRLAWSRSWGRSRAQAAEVSGVAIDAAGGIWVSGFRRDRTNRGLDALARRYAATGAFRGLLRIGGGVTEIVAGGISTGGGAAYMAGWITDRYGYASDGGRLWRLAP